MSIKEEFKDVRGKFRLLSLYQRFEHLVVMFLTALIAVIVIAAVWNLSLKILFEAATMSTSGIAERSQQPGLANFGLARPAERAGCIRSISSTRRSDLDRIFYREGVLELLGLEPVVFEPVVVSSMTISVTSLLSGSINRTRSGSLTKSRFFASGTSSVTLPGRACADMESGTLLPTCGCAPDGMDWEGEFASPWLTIRS
jgi:hypothetical protein